MSAELSQFGPNAQIVLVDLDGTTVQIMCDQIGAPLHCIIRNVWGEPLRIAEGLVPSLYANFLRETAEERKWEEANSGVRGFLRRFFHRPMPERGEPTFSRFEKFAIGS